MTIYDEWSREKQLSLQNLGCNIEVMWTRTNSEKVTSGSEVRDCILHNKAWDHLVPKSVYNYIIQNEIDERIRCMGKGDELE